MLYTLEFPYQDPLQAFSNFHYQPYALFLDSARADPRLGRYAFIAAEPFQVLTSRGGTIQLGNREFTGDPFAAFQAELARYPLPHLPKLPPFQGGAAGYLGYDLCHHLETLPRPGGSHSAAPDMVMGFYDCVLAFDLHEQRAWILSSGFPEQSPRGRAARSRARAHAFRDKLSASAIRPALNDFQPARIQADFTPESYQRAVQRVIDYILSGDIFQANLAQRFYGELGPADTPFALYRRLRAINPAPFAAYLNCGQTVVACASPERFLKLQAGQVETRPIKGTRPRGHNPAEDQRLADELLASEKDRAENVMIVDLLRNDLARVCQPASVHVPELCMLESFASVHHLISTVTGTLRPGTDSVALLQACFPGGSITGAPKVRAMEIIAELEPTPRGPYCGSIGYLGFNGDMDLNISIRTMVLNGNKVSFHAGGGIVADSDPVAEYLETLAKARLLFEALEGRSS